MDGLERRSAGPKAAVSTHPGSTARRFLPAGRAAPIVRHAAGVLAATAIVASCANADDDDQARDPRTTTTATSESRAAVEATLDWLLSPMPVCPPAPDRRSFPGDEPVEAMLELLRLGTRPTVPCPEGGRVP